MHTRIVCLIRIVTRTGSFPGCSLSLPLAPTIDRRHIVSNPIFIDFSLWLPKVQLNSLFQ